MVRTAEAPAVQSPGCAEVQTAVGNRLLVL